MFHMEPFLSHELKSLTTRLVAAGGRPFLVGGIVRDAILGIASKDVDIEVHGISTDGILKVLPKSAKIVGEQFGVIKIQLASGEDVDISIPRRDSKVGKGHDGFLVEFDESMTLEEASARRDFTINAIMFDLVTRRFIDPHGGLADLHLKVIRHTSDAFTEDPLRVLRAAQFAARFDFTVAPETIQLCSSIRDTFRELSKERVWGEWEKIAQKGKNFHRAFDFLEACGWSAHFFPMSRRGARRFNFATSACSDTGVVGHKKTVITLAALAEHTLDPEKFLVSINAPQSVISDAGFLFRNKSEGSFEPRIQARQLARRLGPMTVREAFCFGGISAEVKTAAILVKAIDGPVRLLVRGEDLIAKGLKPGPSFALILGAAEAAQDKEEFFTHEEAIVWLDRHLSVWVEL